jgi:RsiW-degrading membrane proteinase PrsW (M82 family)
MLGFGKNDMNKAKAIFGVFSIFATFIFSTGGINYYLENILNDSGLSALISMCLSGLFLWGFNKMATDWKNL